MYLLNTLWWNQNKDLSQCPHLSPGDNPVVVILLIDPVEELDQVLQPLVIGVVHIEAAVAAAHAVVEGEPARIR